MKKTIFLMSPILFYIDSPKSVKKKNEEKNIVFSESELIEIAKTITRKLLCSRKIGLNTLI